MRSDRIYNINAEKKYVMCHSPSGHFVICTNWNLCFTDLGTVENLRAMLVQQHEPLLNLKPKKPTALVNEGISIGRRRMKGRVVLGALDCLGL